MTAKRRVNLEARRARGEEPSRKGYRNGLADRPVELLKKLALHEALMIFNHMRKENLLVSPEDNIGNDELLVAIEMTRDLTLDPKMRHAAARTVLEWTKPKPASTVNNNVRTAEGFLADLVEDMRK